MSKMFSFARRSGRGAFRRTSAVAMAASVLLAGGAVAIGAPSRSAHGRFDRSGLDGSGAASMQPVTIGVRAALVASVPGSAGEAWALGRSTAKLPGWAGEEGGGQTVFLRYRRATGWRLMGPPRSASGAIANPRLTSLALARDGIGWAVGDGGAMYRLNGDRWVSAPTVTTKLLKSVALGPGYGYALAEGPSAFRLTGGRWAPDPAPITVPEGESWVVARIAVAGIQDAWVSGSDGGAALILRRTASGWTRILTGEELFDERAPRTIENVLISSTRAGAVAATPDGAWIGGTIAPVDTSASLNDVAGDPSRPFVVHVGRSGSITTFCPDRYETGSDGARTTVLCDGPLPLSAFGISDLQAFPGSGRGEVFATGLGFFHYKNGSWTREPDPLGYLSSVGLSTPSEGWVAGPGDSFGVGGSFSTITTLGHWTRRADPVRVARWPQPHTAPFNHQTQPLESVAVAPDGSGRALAVGREGAAMLFSPDTGWDALPGTTTTSFHAVAWPAAAQAWAVGSGGGIHRFRGTAWESDRADGTLTRAALFGVAFSSPDTGYAVGANGTILRFANGAWRTDPASRRVTESDLFAVAAAGTGFVAAGADGVILENTGGAWRRVRGLEPLLGRGGQMPALNAVAATADGSVLAGGELGTLVRRENGRWRIDVEGSRVPPEGTILALAARRTGGALEVFASVTQEPLKYWGDVTAVTTSTMLHGTASGWRDLDHGARYTVYSGFDASGTPEPVFGLALDDGHAWGVGGVAPGVDDGRGHVQAYPTSVVYLIDPDGDPRAAGHTSTPGLVAGPSVISFAFFGESGCGAGLCSSAMGSGTRADTVSSQIRKEINAMATLAGGPKFVVFGGGMRRTGIPEELGEFKRYADGFDVPFFAALGSRDLFRGLDAPAVDTQSTTGVTVEPEVVPNSDFFERVFADRPEPWGNGRRPAGFVAVSMRSSSGARTHYAFDFAPSGSALLRIVVLDDSTAGRLSDGNTQAPSEDQTSWVADVLRDAQAKGVPSIVVMSRPADNPLDVFDPKYVEAETLTATLSQLAPSAVLTSHFRENAVDLLQLQGVSAKAPVFIFGGGGAPLEARQGNAQTKPVPPDPFFGYYHSWQLVTVDLSRLTAGRAEVSVNSFPVVDTVSLHAIDGVSVAAGNTLRFSGSGHVPDGGGPNDPLQSRASVIPFDFKNRGACPPDSARGNVPRCTQAGAVGPAFRFESSDPSVGLFVRPDRFNERLPEHDANGNLIPDASSGLFCGIRAGETLVSVVSGFHRARMLVTVDGGFGTCVKKPVPPLPPRPLPEPPAPLPQPEAVIPLGHFTGATENNAVAIVPPPPVPVVAPAPPAAGGFARKEQHEEAREDAAQKFAALPRSAFRPAPGGGGLGAWPGIGAAVLALMAAVVAGSAVRARHPVRTVVVHAGRRKR